MKRNFTIILVTVMLFLNACKKSSPDQDRPETNPLLELHLNREYMPASKLDSALAIWQMNGKRQTEYMHLAGDTLKASIRKFDPGYGQLTIQLYTKTKVREYDLQWEKRISSTIHHNKSIQMAGPSNPEETTWFPRVIMTDQVTGFTAIVALNPQDPYFLLKNIPQQWNKIEIERGYYKIPGGAESVGKGYWRCTSCADADGTIENREYFSMLPNQINNRPWQMVEIGVALTNNTPHPGPAFYFNHY